MSNGLRSGMKKLIQDEGGAKKIMATGLAELIGTSILVFLGCMGCVGNLGVLPPHIQVTLTFGLAVMIVIQGLGHVSEAHINPAMTVCSVVLGRKSIPQAVVYILAQTIGAVMGYGWLKLVTPREDLTNGREGGLESFCVTDIHPHLSAFQGLLVEGLSTGILALVACGVWDRRNEKNTDSVAIKFGLTVTGLANAVGPYTGCSMNPVRSFAPALWNNYWSHQWIYWFGPIGGALVFSFAYRTIFGVEESREEEVDMPETVALNSVGSHKTEQQP